MSQNYYSCITRKIIDVEIIIFANAKPNCDFLQVTVSSITWGITTCQVHGISMDLYY